MTTQKNIGYSIISNTTYRERLCFLTIGSIIKFNGQKHIVIHTTNSPRKYDHSAKSPIDLTMSCCGFLKNIETGKEFRANWQTTREENILHFEHLDKVNL